MNALELGDIIFTEYYGRKHRKDAKRLWKTWAALTNLGFLGKTIREGPWVKTNVLTSKEDTGINRKAGGVGRGWGARGGRRKSFK